MRKAVLGVTALVALVLLWSEIIAAIGALLSVLGTAIVYTILAGCVVAFLGMLFDIKFESSEDGEPVYHG